LVTPLLELGDLAPGDVQVDGELGDPVARLDLLALQGVDMFVDSGRVLDVKEGPEQIDQLEIVRNRKPRVLSLLPQLPLFDDHVRQDDPGVRPVLCAAQYCAHHWVCSTNLRGF
jgi:hypothetical protein